ncbi:hypothetical protein V6R21_17260 [Limibacter armeniacum]|uniref:hypothetical protein n=1 Tax=Limibacter armeniacum TaxID=466084 RepID=UPI002FE67186
MKNFSVVSTDRVNVYVISEIRSTILGKIIISMMLLSFIAVLFYGAFQFEPNEESKINVGFIFGVLIIGFILFLGFKYLLWNMFGEETLIVNNNHVSYHRGYGIVNTAVTTFNFDRMGIEYAATMKYEGVQYGNIVFINYRKPDNLPEEIFESGIEVSEAVYNEMIDCLNNIYNNERGLFLPFSQN